MFKFAPVFLKKIKLILLIKLFVSSVFLFMYFVSGRESGVKGKFIWHTSYEICMIFIKMPILNGKKMN